MSEYFLELYYRYQTGNRVPEIYQHSDALLPLVLSNESVPVMFLPRCIEFSNFLSPLNRTIAFNISGSSF